MKEVRAGLTWVPKLTDVKLAPCPNPPSLDEIRAELVRLIEPNLNTLDDALKGPVRSLMLHLRNHAGDK